MHEEIADFAAGSSIAILAWFFGGLDGFLSVLVTFVIIDWVMGTLDGCIHGGFSHQDFLKAGAKKLAEFCFVGIAHIIDKYIFNDTSTFRIPVILFYVSIEGISIIKHADNLELPIPKFFKARFLEMNEKYNEGETKTDNLQGAAIRGEGIKKSSDTAQEPVIHEKVKQDIKSVYTRMFDGD